VATGGGAATGGGTGTGGGAAGTTTLPAIISTNLSVSGDVLAPGNTSIASGATLTVAAGSVLRVAANATLTVSGALVISGTKASFVELDSETRTGAGLWSGLVIASGGSATLAHVNFHHAAVAFSAQAGSTWSITGFRVDTSNAAFSVASSGTARYGTVHGLGVVQAYSPIGISNASPSFTDVLIDNANGGIDMVVGSGGGPTFDHVEVTASHCAFHFGAGTDITVRNSNIHDNAYVLMNYGAVNTRYTGNNFLNNSVNIGACSAGGTFVGTSNYATGTMLDASCAAQQNLTPVASPIVGVGPRPEP
jgi:hypothetical protein